MDELVWEKHGGVEKPQYTIYLWKQLHGKQNQYRHNIS